MIRLLALCLSVSALSAASSEYGVDARWWHPTDSHHLQHAIVGAAVGFATDAALQFTAVPRWQRVTAATGAALVVGVAIEYVDPDEPFRARSDGALIDPADIAWTALSGLLGAATAELTGAAIRFHLSPAGASASLAWRF